MLLTLIKYYAWYHLNTIAETESLRERTSFLDKSLAQLSQELSKESVRSPAPQGMSLEVLAISCLPSSAVYFQKAAFLTIKG